MGGNVPALLGDGDALTDGLTDDEGLTEADAEALADEDGETLGDVRVTFSVGVDE